LITPEFALKAYPGELRTRIVDAVDRRVGSVPAVAALFRVSRNCVATYLHLRAETGSLEPRPNPGGRPPALPPPRYGELRRRLAQEPDLTLAHLRDRLGLGCSLAALCRTLQKLGLTRNNNTRHAAAQQRPAVPAAREAWAAWQAGLTAADLRRLVSWDETWAITARIPLCGRAPAGQRVVGSVPQGPGQRLTLMAGLRLGGVCGPLAFAASADAAACQAFATHGLGPGLRPGDIVLLDTRSSHLDAGVVAALERPGVPVKPRPPDAPDCNPIEQAFAKVKQALRRARARTGEALIEAIGAALRAITPEDIRGWFKHSGYHTDS
jgi:transposase